MVYELVGVIIYEASNSLMEDGERKDEDFYEDKFLIDVFLVFITVI